MSRHDLALAEGRTLTIGWDPSLQTYFAVLIAPEHDGPEFWVGDNAYELYDLDALERALGRHRDHLTPTLASQLYRDRDEGS